MSEEEAALALKLQREIIELLERQVAELQASLAARDAKIHQFQLVDALRQWKPARKRPGAPKKLDEVDDLAFLIEIEAIQQKFGLTRAKALDLLIAVAHERRRHEGRPRFNADRLKQQRKTLLNRLSIASKRRPEK